MKVKYKEEIKPADIRGVLRFLEAFSQKCGMVVTKNLLGKKEIDDRLILYIPAWLFLLIFPGRGKSYTEKSFEYSYKSRKKHIL